MSYQHDIDGNRIGWRYPADHGYNEWSMCSDPPEGERVDWLEPMKIDDLKHGYGVLFYLGVSDHTPKYLRRRSRVVDASAYLISRPHLNRDPDKYIVVEAFVDDEPTLFLMTRDQIVYVASTGPAPDRTTQEPITSLDVLG